MALDIKWVFKPCLQCVELVAEFLAAVCISEEDVLEPSEEVGVGVELADSYVEVCEGACEFLWEKFVTTASSDI